MALNPNSSAAWGMFKAVRDGLSIFGPTNKTEQQKGATDKIKLENEYSSKLEDSSILDLVKQWIKDYDFYYDPIKHIQETSFHYWAGKQTGPNLTARSTTSDPKPIVDNLIFTALETFLPLATRANPDPVVSSDPSPIGQKLGKLVESWLVKEADRQLIRRKLASLLRQWSWNLIGVIKFSWDYETKEIVTEVINPKRIIFDKNGHVDERGFFTGEYIGEKKSGSVKEIIDLFPDFEKEILEKAQDKKATKMDYFEWWYKNKDVFFTMDDLVLGKFKNPHWNYDMESIKNESGKEIRDEIKGKNFFKKISSPYVFLSIFSAGRQPHDETGLIIQNVQLNDIANARLRQLNMNIDHMNNGLAISGDAFTDDQAAGAANAWQKGEAVLVPTGRPSDAVMRLEAPPLPEQVYEQLRDMRAEVMSVFGTYGSTPQGVEEQKTARGKILVAQQDVSRIGGTITEHLEQVADTIYQWWIQLMFVHYDDDHFVMISGAEGGMELIAIRNTMFSEIQNLDVTVKEGSLIPKDPLTQRNEAMDWWEANVIDPLTFYEKMDVPDPAKYANRLILWQMVQKGQISPSQYLPDFQTMGQSSPQSPQSPGQSPVEGQPQPINPQLGLPAPQSSPQSTGPETTGAVEQRAAQLIGAVPLPR